MNKDYTATKTEQITVAMNRDNIDNCWELKEWLISQHIHPEIANIIRNYHSSSVGNNVKVTKNKIPDTQSSTTPSRGANKMQPKDSNNNPSPDAAGDAAGDSGDFDIISHIVQQKDHKNIIKKIILQHQEDLFEIISNALCDGINLLKEQRVLLPNNNATFNHHHTSRRTKKKKKKKKKKDETCRKMINMEHQQGSSNSDDGNKDINEKNVEGKFNAGLPGLQFDSLETFFGGLDGIVGVPNPKILKAMTEEHKKKFDSERCFQPPNYIDVGLTSSEKEWNKQVTKKRQSGISSALLNEMKEKNIDLISHGHPPLIEEELLALRLYTGPMYRKYNSVTRGLRGKSIEDFKLFIELCGDDHAIKVFKEEEKKARNDLSYDMRTTTIDWTTIFKKHCNLYTTTLHAINSGIIKLSKLTKATKVYRGITDRSLPDTFLNPNAFNVKGGVELGFLSTTKKKESALDYANRNKGVGILFEIEQGMVDRGADVQWLSQHPEEDEILFPPLTGIEVRGKRVEGSVVIIEVALSINLVSSTIEQVIEKRLKLLKQMKDDIVIELESAISSSSSGTNFLLLAFQAEVERCNILGNNGTWYNNDNNFVKAIQQMLDIKKHCTLTKRRSFLDVAKQSSLNDVNNRKDKWKTEQDSWSQVANTVKLIQDDEMVE